jgi:hypothetical protein
MTSTDFSKVSRDEQNRLAREFAKDAVEIVKEQS